MMVKVAPYVAEVGVCSIGGQSGYQVETVLAVHIPGLLLASFDPGS